MNNADMPAMAVKVVASIAAQRQAKGLGVDCEDVTFTGLTKREHFAAMAMQGILCGINSNVAEGEWHGWDCSDFAREAISTADALLAALEIDND